MPMTLEQFGIDKLDQSERIDLALAIWDSLDENARLPPLTNKQRLELTKRNAELDANPEIAMTWEEIRSQVESNP